LHLGLGGLPSSVVHCHDVCPLLLLNVQLLLDSIQVIQVLLILNLLGGYLLTDDLGLSTTEPIRVAIHRTEQILVLGCHDAVSLNVKPIIVPIGLDG
jgi:hypothetical protein